MEKYKWIRLIVFILMFMVIVILLPASVFAQAEIDKVSKSVVQIAYKLPDNDAWRNWFRRNQTVYSGIGDFDERDLYVQVGSGFLIGVDASQEYRYVVTNYHVVDRSWGMELDGFVRADDGTNVNLRNMRFRENEVELYVLRARDDYVPVTVYDSLKTSDVAVLEIDPRHRLFGYEPIELGHSGMVQRGSDVWAIGFPGVAEVVADLTTAVFTDSTITKGIISRVTSSEGVPVYQTDTAISGGNSGGPLVNKDGVIIGINTFGLVYMGIIPSEINYAVQIDVLTDFLRSRGIPFLEAGASSTDAEPAPETEPEPIPEPVPIPEPPVEITQPEVEESGFPLLYIVLGAAALILIIVLILILSKGKQPAPAVAGQAMSSSPTMPAPPTQRVSAPVTQAGHVTAAAAPVTRAKPVGPSAKVKGISGQFAGQNIELVQGQLVIGRDPKMAQLVYPQSFDEISRKHLTIRYEESSQKFSIEDSSSNGTFLTSGQRLETGKLHYLNKGDRFYISDPKEVFELSAD